ncbi:sestrin-1 isoform X4 [Narcine bancroftii]|uniref:sestrin-1 isoform X4 n=1 Tax=Narcine bancroftii TaxID=1343680 RepID=UPI003831CFD3
MAGDAGAAGRWGALCSRDLGRRQAALDGVGQAVLSWSESLGDTKGGHSGGPPNPSGSPTDGLNEYLVRLLGLSKSCPFGDVRDRCGTILQAVQEMGVRIPRPLAQGPSEFIPEKEILQLGREDAETRLLLIEAFATFGRLDNITLLMGFHPQYLDSFLKTQHYLMQVDGPLPYCYRHYIAIMNLLKAEEHGWSLAELIHVVVLLTHYHSLASFTFGCGINPEIHCEGGHTFQLPSLSHCYLSDCMNGNNVVEERLNGQEGSEGTGTTCEVQALMEKMKHLQECRDEEETSQEEMATRFEREKAESFFVAPSENKKSIDTREISRHFEDPSYGYKDFSRHGEQYVPTFRAQDYTWEDHGYSLVNRLYPDVGQLLDEKFQKAYNLTYNTMAMHKDVDTSMLRRAIWNYIHCMFGIRYDDYDYGEINQLLDRNFKVYIKTVVCSPAKTIKIMYDSFWRQFKHSEKIHVNLLLMEARMQAELLYALTAITRYLT